MRWVLGRRRHGSSRQRVAWFRQGLRSGRVDACDTFRERLPDDG